MRTRLHGPRGGRPPCRASRAERWRALCRGAVRGLRFGHDPSSRDPRRARRSLPGLPRGDDVRAIGPRRGGIRSARSPSTTDGGPTRTVPTLPRVRGPVDVLNERRRNDLRPMWILRQPVHAPAPDHGPRRRSAGIRRRGPIRPAGRRTPLRWRQPIRRRSPRTGRQGPIVAATPSLRQRATHGREPRRR